jgi:hypothetical protein
MMDCEQVKELLDAYALGAAEADEAIAIEEHVADCVRCWSSLDEAQRAAAAIALSTAFRRPPQSLRDRIVAEAERGESAAGPRFGALLRRLWPAGAGLLAAGAAASLAFALVLQSEVSDLNDKNDSLVAQMDAAGDQLGEQRQLMAVLASPDVQGVSLKPTDPASQAEAVYYWSSGTGALLCNNLPALEPGQAYQVWLLTEDESYFAGSLATWDGIGQLGMDLRDLPERPIAIGVSIEDDPGAQTPREMFLYAEFR